MLKGKRWKRMLAILLTVMMCVQFVPMDGLRVVMAEEPGTLLYTLINNKKEIEISGYEGSATSIVLPNELFGKPVTSIGEEAFMEYTSLTSITIPESVTNIGQSAFYGCSSLTSITIPKNVTNIGDMAFAGCSKLSSLTLQEGVTSIGYGAFYECTSLTNVIIPSSITSIGDLAFYGCSKLSSVTIESDFRNIGERIFDKCANNLVIYVQPDSHVEEWAKICDYTIAYIGGQNSDNKVNIPKVAKVTKFKVTAKKKGFNISWKKVSGASGYEIQISKKKKFKGASTCIINYNTFKSKAKCSISKLKSKKKYYIRIRAYKYYEDAHGEMYKAYGPYVSVNKKTK